MDLVIRMHTIIITALISIVAVFPKIAALTSTWILSFEYKNEDVVFLLAQDMTLFCLMWAGLYLILRKYTLKRALLALALTVSVFFLNMFDFRTRELWMQPIDYELIKYALINYNYLKDGNDLFFKQTSAFGVTFRKLIFFSTCSIVLVYLIGTYLMHKFQYKKVRNVSFGIIWSICISVCISISIVAPKYDYKYEENLIVSSFFDFIRNSEELIEINVNTELFEQKPVLYQTLMNSDRVILKETPIFKNLVLIVLESVRSKEFYSENNKKQIMPFLKKLSDEGMALKSYVSVPHSSKAYYSILTGRYPYPGSLLKEMMDLKHSSVVNILKNKYQKKTYAYSGMYLAFENTNKLLSSCGFDLIKDHPLLIENDKDNRSSFGGCDDKLLTTPFKEVDLQSTSGIVLGFFPFGAHYPYLYPDKKADALNNIECYYKSLESVDNWLEMLFKQMNLSGLIDNSLVVIVGDHGESFGEHGYYVHNNSMYEEEAVVPLIFWAKDKSLKVNLKNNKFRHIDIAPTIADFMGVYSEHYKVQGESILRNREHLTHFGASFTNNVSRSMVVAGTKYIYKPNSDTLIRYNLLEDTNETSPIVTTGTEFDSVRDKINEFYYYQKYYFSENKK